MTGLKRLNSRVLLILLLSHELVELEVGDGVPEAAARRELVGVEVAELVDQLSGLPTQKIVHRFARFISRSISARRISVQMMQKHDRWCCTETPRRESSTSHIAGPDPTAL